MSIVIERGIEEVEILPKESVDVTVIELTPSLSADDGVIEKLPAKPIFGTIIAELKL